MGSNPGYILKSFLLYNSSKRNLVTLQVTALLFIKGRSDMQMKLGTLFACRSFCFATSWRQSDLQCTMFYCMRREIFSDQFFGWIMVKGPDIKCIKNLGSCLKSNGGPRPWFAQYLSWEMRIVKFIYSEKATKLCEIFPLPLTTIHTFKSKGKISQNFVAFTEYMNCKLNILQQQQHVTNLHIAQL